MGLILTKLLATLFSKREARVLMLGLDNAGKTTILYKLKLGEVVATIPTLGFNVETLQFRGLTLTVWDVGGQGCNRRLWRHYYLGTHGLVFVVDSSDGDRVAEAGEELSALLANKELRGAAVLVVANKQDVEGAMGVAEVAERLGIVGAARGRRWHVQGACAASGEGLCEGLDWLSRNMVFE